MVKNSLQAYFIARLKFVVFVVVKYLTIADLSISIIEIHKIK